MITFVKEINSDNFQETINSGLVLIDIYAEWCGPCKALSPIIDEVGAHFSETVTVGKLDADKNSDLITEMGVRSIPTVLIYKDGQVVDKFTGLKSKAYIISLVESHI